MAMQASSGCIKRACVMFAALICLGCASGLMVQVRAQELPIGARQAAPDRFQDVPEGHWAFEAIQRLSALGIFTGYPDGRFVGQQAASRYELAVVAARLLNQVDLVLEVIIDDPVLVSELREAGLELGQLASLEARVTFIEQSLDEAAAVGYVRALEARIIALEAAMNSLTDSTDFPAEYDETTPQTVAETVLMPEGSAPEQTANEGFTSLPSLPIQSTATELETGDGADQDISQAGSGSAVSSQTEMMDASTMPALVLQNESHRDSLQEQDSANDDTILLEEASEVADQNLQSDDNSEVSKVTKEARREGFYFGFSPGVISSSSLVYLSSHMGYDNIIAPLGVYSRMMLNSGDDELRLSLGVRAQFDVSASFDIYTGLGLGMTVRPEGTGLLLETPITIEVPVSQQVDLFLQLLPSYAFRAYQVDASFMGGINFRF